MEARGDPGAHKDANRIAKQTIVVLPRPRGVAPAISGSVGHERGREPETHTWNASEGEREEGNEKCKPKWQTARPRAHRPSALHGRRMCHRTELKRDNNPFKTWNSHEKRYTKLEGGTPMLKGRKYTYG